ncbi:MAG: hypothetical protein JWR75_1501 [Devosia sp.]|nr:hypothetical protein [Devosia sp.]
MQPQALSVIVNWMKLERALEGYAVGLRRQFGITGLQLAILRILSERPEHALAALRKSLVLHPATLGQAIDELRVMGLCTVRTNPADRRARVVAITEKGAGIVREAPLAGPVRLRQTDNDVARLDRLAAALADAMELFGLEDASRASSE